MSGVPGGRQNDFGGRTGTVRYPTALDLIKARQSDREFTDETVLRWAIARILGTACQASAGSNSRGAWIVVVDGPAWNTEIKRRCEPSDAQWIQSRLEPLPSPLPGLPGPRREKDCLTIRPIFLVVGSKVGKPECPYAHEPAWRAIENMRSAVTELGSGR